MAIDDADEIEGLRIRLMEYLGPKLVELARQVEDEDKPSSTISFAVALQMTLVKVAAIQAARLSNQSRQCFIDLARLMYDESVAEIE